MNFPAALDEARTITLEANQPVFHQGSPCENYIVVTSGSVKVFSRAATGKEVTLYHVNPGQMCVLTTSCLIGNQSYPAEAICEGTVEAKVLSKTLFTKLLDESAEFREFVFSSYSQRIADLMLQIGQIALEGIQPRLASFLLRYADDSGVVSRTHQNIALDIGSAREVVSRHLKEMEKRGLISLKRGEIFLLNKDVLQSLTQQYLD